MPHPPCPFTLSQRADAVEAKALLLQRLQICSKLRRAYCRARAFAQRTPWQTLLHTIGLGLRKRDQRALEILGRKKEEIEELARMIQKTPPSSVWRLCRNVIDEALRLRSG